MTTHNWMSLAFGVLVGVLALWRGSGVSWLMFFGFMASCVGDWFLSVRPSGKWYFLYGVLSFSVAHILFMVYAWRLGGDWSRWLALILAIVYIPYVVFFLVPRVSPPVVLAAVVLYAVLSLTTLTLSSGMRIGRLPKILFICGIGFLVFSDTLISLRNFLDVKPVGKWVIPTYVLSHIFLFASSVSYLLLDIGKQVEDL